MPLLLTGFHLALSTTAAGLERLATGLRALEHFEQPILHLGLHASAQAEVVALLGFADPRSATLAIPRLKTLALTAGARFIDLGNLDAAGRNAFEAHLATFDRHGEAQAIDQAIEQLSRASPQALLSLDFASFEELYAAWAAIVAEGAMWVPSARPHRGTAFRLTLVVAGQPFTGSTATLARPASTSNDGRPGYWLDVTPSEQLMTLFDRHARERHQGRASTSPEGVARAAPRFQTLLEVAFENLPELASSWATDISHGGMFISCKAPPDLRSRVNVKIALPSGGLLELEAEVVHRVVSGSRPGAGVQFLDQNPEVLAPIRALLDGYQRRQPRVLVVDDEAIWRSTLARALGALGCDVQLAADGREGLVKLIDGYFELDLVILDLHMPNLDGRGLIERVRRLGGDSGLKLFLFSAAGPEELESLAMPGMATGVFSKLESIDALTARIARELGLQFPPPASRAKAA